MKYQPDLSGFVPWQPSTWPKPPKSWEPGLGSVIERIFKEALMNELEGVVGDAIKCNGSLAHRGYVIGLGLLCAVDALASYAYTGGVGVRYRAFIKHQFPPEYQPHAEAIYKLHRNSLVHSWHLFEASITAGNESIQAVGGTVTFGLINFLNALRIALDNLLKRVMTDPTCNATYSIDTSNYTRPPAPDRWVIDPSCGRTSPLPARVTWPPSPVGAPPSESLPDLRYSPPTPK